MSESLLDTHYRINYDELCTMILNLRSRRFRADSF
jgi:hypothetical protein